MSTEGRKFDVLVIGGGHAGCEAALAAARMGCDTLLVTGDASRIGWLPCNCSIGGPAKGHLVREVDALGGAMAVVTDATLTHLRMLNTGKGPAVRALRAQVDKTLYPRAMRDLLAATQGLTVEQAMVDEILTEAGTAAGVQYADGTIRRARAVVVTTGTFLRGLCHRGEERWEAGDWTRPRLRAFRLAARSRLPARSAQDRHHAPRRERIRGLLQDRGASRPTPTRRRSRSARPRADTTTCCLRG
jgi:tRNA uridine 5-carboxymethylaminomethyl modification enzyme